MKKRFLLVISFVVFGILFYSAPEVDASTEHLKIPHRFNAYESPSFLSKKVSSFGAQTVTVYEKKGDYWYLIKTKFGKKWTYYNPNLKDRKINTRFIGYEKPSFESNRVTGFKPTTVKVIGKYSKHWYLIESTNHGNVWVYHDPNWKITKKDRFYTFNSASFNDEMVSSFAPQTVNVIGKRGDHWYAIHTQNFGEVWMYHDPNWKKSFKNRFQTFAKPNFYSKRVTSFAPQTVKVVNRVGDWYQIKTSKFGKVWVYGKSNWTYKMKNRLTGYKSYSFNSKKVSSFAPQTVNVLNRVGDWYEIKTGKFGNLWINPKEVDLKPNWAIPLNSKSYIVTSKYGHRSSGFHHGIDLAQNGTVKILAAADGTVSRSYFSDRGYGEVVFIRHSIGGKTYETVYAHMRRGSRKVSAGTKVRQGQVIGYMGSTGYSTGQHLHFEVHQPRWNSSKSYSINPEKFIDF